MSTFVWAVVVEPQKGSKGHHDGRTSITCLPNRINSRSRSPLLYKLMDVVKAVETYVSKMISMPSSMKVLLLDSHTVCCRYSLAYEYPNCPLTQ